MDRPLIEMQAEWLYPGVIVVGHLTIGMSGLTFRSLIPNPDRSLDVPIATIESAIVGDAHPHTLEVARPSGALRFLTADPRACALALDQALSVHRARTAYR